MNNNNNSNNNQMEWKKIRQLFKVIIFINGSMNMRNHFLLLATREKWRKRNKHKRKTNHEDVRLTHIPSKCGGTTTKFDNLIHKNNFQIDNFQCVFSRSDFYSLRHQRKMSVVNDIGVCVLCSFILIPSRHKKMTWNFFY